MKKLFPAQLTAYDLISHLHIIHSSYYAWPLNVHCNSWQCNFRLAAVTAEFFWNRFRRKNIRLLRHFQKNLA